MESGVWLCTTIYFFQQKNKAPTTCVVMRTGVELSKTSEENTRRISKFCLSFGLLSTSRGLRSPPRLPGCSAGRSTRGRRPRRSIPSSGMRSTCPATASATARTSSRLRRGHGGCTGSRHLSDSLRLCRQERDRVVVGRQRERAHGARRGH